jgi:hypothetical protein
MTPSPDTRYCSSCISYKDKEAGKVIQTSNKNIRRWVCNACLNKMSPQRLRSKK